MALALYLQLVFGWEEDRARTIEQMGELSAQAIAADANDAYALVVASFAKLCTHDVAAAIEFGRKSIAANPNLAIAHTALGHALVFSGQYENGVESLDLSLRLSPRDPLMALGLIVLGLGHYLLKRYEVAERTGRKVTLEQPNMPGGYRLLAASLAQLGRLDEARSVVADHILRLIPGHTADQAGEQLPFGDNREGRRHLLEGLVKAGLPE